MLIIQSQDKTFIGKVDNVSLQEKETQRCYDELTKTWYVRKKCIIYSGDIILGKYYNLDKALKVIEDIKEHINGNNKLLVKEDGSMEVITINRVFEMPKSEEDENENN